jgi:tetratricopeptide (TPR) repeat protein
VSAPDDKREADELRRIAALEARLAMDPGAVLAAQELSAIFIRRRETKKAEVVLRLGLVAAPDHAGLMTNLGGLLAGTDRQAEALDLLRLVVQQAPNSPMSHYNLGIGLKAGRQFAEAAAAFRATVERDPAFADAHLNLGHALLEEGETAAAAAAYDAALLLRRAPGPQKGPIGSDPRELLLTHEAKLRHDIEQLRYLQTWGHLSFEHAGLIPAYEAALAALPPAPSGAGTVELPAAHATRLRPVYNRLLYLDHADYLPDGAVDHRLEPARVEAEYAADGIGIAVVDNLLTEPALKSLRNFCLRSTIWFHCRYAQGYLGAFMDDGFCCPLLLQAADELRHALPGIFGRHRLRRMWAFKYDSLPGSAVPGIPIHADFAAVNLNFWVTPDDANLDPEGGGLTVWDKRMPQDWELWRYKDDIPAIRKFLADSGARALRVPYRQNRAVIFNSDLFHETDSINFQEGYENRRINITMLFGQRQGT